MLYRSVEITLIENSTAGNPPKVFAGQTADVTHEPDTVVTSVDGKISVGHHPSKIIWREGKAIDLKNITDVKIAGQDGAVLLDAEVNRTFEVPRDCDRGVEFSLLRR
jgi:hypothetical protein